MKVHTIQPVFDKTSSILILGSFPSVKSREGQFFYHHPQNRFWKIMAYLCQEEIPLRIEDKKKMLLQHRIALWDVIHSCDIVGSSDQSIDNVVVNNIRPIIEQANIKRVFTNGALATKLYHKHMEKLTGIKAISLPSSSPANASYSLEKLQSIWQERIGEIR